MGLSYLPAGRRAFVPRPCGFGGRLLGFDPGVVRVDAAAAIRATRQERDLLRGDLTVIGADGTLLLDAVGSAVDPADHDLLELGDPEGHAALATALAVARALGGEGEIGVLLTGPLALAEHVAGRSVDADRDEGLIDACGMVVCDAAKAVLDTGAHVVLEERRAPEADELSLCTSLLNLLAHHRRPALAIVHDKGAGALGGGHAGIGGTVTGRAVPRWGAAWDVPPGAPVFAPHIAADASPERVQDLIAGLDVVPAP